MPRALVLALVLLTVLTTAPGTAGARQAADDPGGTAGQGMRGLVAEGVADIDVFWSRTFAEAREEYVPPGVVDLVGEVDTGCGFFNAYDSPAFYCPLDGTIYVALWFLAEQEAQFGDYAWHNVLAHEWGHHVQNLLGVEQRPDNSFELQADCLAGAYAQDAAGRGVLSAGDVTEAVLTSAAAGDDPFFPQDQPGAHGTNDDRVTAFMSGYIDGVARCGLPIELPSSPGGAPPATTLAGLLPTVGDVPRGLALVEEGARGEQAIVATFPNPGDAARRFAEWGWEENAYRTFADAVGTGSIQASLHRFRTAIGAAAALPYFVDGRIAALGLAEVAAAPLGDRSAAVAGSVTDGYEVTLYVQRAELLLRLTAVAVAGDPTADAEAVARTIMGEGGAVAVPSPPTPLGGLLPTAGDVGGGLVAVEEGARGVAEVTASFPDPAEATGLFAEWGWAENAYRHFGPGSGGAALGLTSVEISLHRFGSAAGAAAALPYFAEGRAAVLGLRAVPVPPLGDGAVAVGGRVAAGRETTVYVQVGDVLARVSVVSAAGDPAPDAVAVAGLVVANAA